MNKADMLSSAKIKMDGDNHAAIRIFFTKSFMGIGEQAEQVLETVSSSVVPVVFTNIMPICWIVYGEHILLLFESSALDRAHPSGAIITHRRRVLLI